MDFRTSAGRWLALGTFLCIGAIIALRADALGAQTRPSAPEPDALAPAPVYSTAATIRFAVIGDYGYDGVNELAVANIVKGWSPDFIITVGDNNYDAGATSTIEPNIGKYYHDYMFPYTGTYTTTALTNKFFPSLGNHDWGTPNAQPYLDFFTLPGNERYYDFIWGPAHFFAIDSDANEPDGNTKTSKQAVWLERKLAFATGTWNLVYFHHAPWSSSTVHGSNGTLQWPYQSWGASAVLAGHVHNYERIIKNNFPYFVNGLGGNPNIYGFSVPMVGSEFRFNATHGAMLVTADDSQIVFKFHSITDTINALDTYTLTTKPSINRSYMPLIKR